MTFSLWVKYVGHTYWKTVCGDRHFSLGCAWLYFLLMSGVSMIPDRSTILTDWRGQIQLKRSSMKVELLEKKFGTKGHGDSGR